MKIDAMYFRTSTEKSGAALVLTLALVVLVTILILTFFTQVNSNALVETSRANDAEVDVLVHSAGDYVTAQFLQEIANSSLSKNTANNGIITYAPLYGTNAIPQHKIASSLLSNTNFLNLVRQSIPSADTNSSIIVSDSPDVNGRFVSTNFWNMPVLVSGAGFNNTTQLPDWIFIRQSGQATTVASPDVIGRFAYNVYDLGSLLDINAAGYPSTLSQQQISDLKGTLAGADLTQLPGIQQADVDALVSFRNPNATSSYANGTAAAAYVGFISSLATNLTTGQAYTNNYFTSRQDLLRYARTQNIDFTNAAPYLTHFSRTLNAPSWMPSNPPGATNDYQAIANGSTSTNRNIPFVPIPSGNTGTVTITHYRDDGTTEPPYTIITGQSLMQRPFSLAKVAWIGPTGPNSTAFNASLTVAQQTKAIQSCFGLVWNTDHWEYLGSKISASTVLSSIDTLGQIASDLANGVRTTEPNFFETLKAGILSGSVGLGPATGYSTMASSFDTGTLQVNADLQILRIGANIIDCAGSTNYPSTFDLMVSGSLMPIHGIKDLPYLNLCSIAALYVSTPTTFPSSSNYNQTRTMNHAALVLIPELFNPHQTSITIATTGPAAIRIGFLRGNLTAAQFAGSGASSTVPTTPSAVSQLQVSGSSLGIYATLNSDTRSNWIQIPSSSFETFRPTPHVVNNTNAVSSTKLSDYFSWLVSPGQATFHTFVMFDWEHTFPLPAPNITFYDFSHYQQNSEFKATVDFSNPLMLVAEFQDPTNSNVWHVYDTMAGNEGSLKSGIASSLATSAQPSPTAGSPYNVYDTLSVNNSSDGGVSFFSKWDPRTTRFGPSGGFYREADSGPFFPGGKASILEDLPFAGSSSYPSLWPQGAKTVGSPLQNEQDVDGVIRPADAWLGLPANSTSANSANLYQSATSPSSPTRPVILHRPYRSVAELGYVFRDDPWKSLSFFDSTSGDSALLDLFCVNDAPLIVAGRVNLNTPSIPILQALLNNTYQDVSGNPIPSPGTVAGALINYSFTSGMPSTNMPSNVANLVGFMSSSSGASSAIIKPEREAVVRALTGSTQTRTWNLLLDVVAQTGRFSPKSAPVLENFIVKGEKHYWVSVAIDRYTDKIIDEQWEPVND